jgi:hypothetical protein
MLQPKLTTYKNGTYDAWRTMTATLEANPFVPFTVQEMYDAMQSVKNKVPIEEGEDMPLYRVGRALSTLETDHDIVLLADNGDYLLKGTYQYNNKFAAEGSNA